MVFFGSFLDLGWYPPDEIDDMRERAKKAVTRKLFSNACPFNILCSERRKLRPVGIRVIYDAHEYERVLYECSECGNRCTVSAIVNMDQPIVDDDVSASTDMTTRFPTFATGTNNFLTPAGVIDTPASMENEFKKALDSVPSNIAALHQLLSKVNIAICSTYQKSQDEHKATLDHKVSRLRELQKDYDTIKKDSNARIEALEEENKKLKQRWDQAAAFFNAQANGI